MEVGNSLGRVNHSDRRASFVASVKISNDSSSLLSREFIVDGGKDRSETVVRVSVNFSKSLLVLGESSLEITLDSVSKEDGVRFLHHSSLKMER